MQPKPKVNFTFPIRWLKDNKDRKYLKENINNNIRGNFNSVPMHHMLAQVTPAAYFVRIKQHAYQPVGYKITKEEIEEILKDTFVGARCVGLEKFFVQTDRTTSLPVMEFELFY